MQPMVISVLCAILTISSMTKSAERCMAAFHLGVPGRSMLVGKGQAGQYGRN